MAFFPAPEKRQEIQNNKTGIMVGRILSGKNTLENHARPFFFTLYRKLSYATQRLAAFFVLFFLPNPACGNDWANPVNLL
jgi:hypothetical protein